MTSITEQKIPQIKASFQSVPLTTYIIDESSKLLADRLVWSVGIVLRGRVHTEMQPCNAHPASGKPKGIIIVVGLNRSVSPSLKGRLNNSHSSVLVLFGAKKRQKVTIVGRIRGWNSFAFLGAMGSRRKGNRGNQNSVVSKIGKDYSRRVRFRLEVTGESLRIPGLCKLSQLRSVDHDKLSGGSRK